MSRLRGVVGGGVGGGAELLTLCCAQEEDQDLWQQTGRVEAVSRRRRLRAPHNTVSISQGCPASLIIQAPIVQGSMIYPNPI